MDQDGPKPDAKEVVPPEYQRAKEIKKFSDQRLVVELLDCIDIAFDSYDADATTSDAISNDEKARLLEMISELRQDFGLSQSDAEAGEIHIGYKIARPEDEERLERGEDVGVNVEIRLPRSNKTIVLNVWGSRRDYESSKLFSSDHRRTDVVIDKPRTINFHTYKTRKGDPSHGIQETQQLQHDARYVMFRSGHPRNRLDIMTFDGHRIPGDERPRHYTSGYVTDHINGYLYALTDELYNRRNEEDQ